MVHAACPRFPCGRAQLLSGSWLFSRVDRLVDAFEEVAAAFDGAADLGGDEGAVFGGCEA